MCVPVLCSHQSHMKTQKEFWQDRIQKQGLMIYLLLRMKGWGYQPVQFHAFTYKENRVPKGKLLVCQQKTN